MVPETGCAEQAEASAAPAYKLEVDEKIAFVGLNESSVSKELSCMGSERYALWKPARAAQMPELPRGTFRYILVNAKYWDEVRDNLTYAARNSRRVRGILVASGASLVDMVRKTEFHPRNVVVFAVPGLLEAVMFDPENGGQVHAAPHPSVRPPQSTAAPVQPAVMAAAGAASAEAAEQAMLEIFRNALRQAGGHSESMRSEIASLKEQLAASQAQTQAAQEELREARQAIDGLKAMEASLLQKIQQLSELWGKAASLLQNGNL